MSLFAYVYAKSNAKMFNGYYTLQLNSFQSLMDCILNVEQYQHSVILDVENDDNSN